MNGGIIGKANTKISGLWMPHDVLNDTNNIAKKPINIDDCDSATGWMVPDSGRSVALLTSGQHAGGGWLTLIKTNTTQPWVCSGKFFGLDLTEKSLGFWFYVKDSATLDKISTVNIQVMNDIATPTTYRTWAARHMFTSITTGWQLLEYPISSFETFLGTADFLRCAYLEVSVDTIAANKTFASGYIGFDDVFCRRI